MANKSGRKSTLRSDSVRDVHNSRHGKAGLGSDLREAKNLQELERIYTKLTSITGASTKTRKQWQITYEVCKKALEGKATEGQAGEALSKGAAAPEPVPALPQNEEANPEGDGDEE